MTFINTHSLPELRTAFDKLPKPKKRWLAKAVDAAFESIPDAAVGPVKIGPLKKVAKRFTEDSALRAAAWRWLRPEEESDLLDATQLVDLQRKFDLEHLQHGEFCRRLADVCSAYAETVPALARYVDKRIADIEVRLISDTTHADLASTMFEAYQRALLTATMAHHSSRAPAIELSHTILRKILAASSAAIASTLDAKAGEGCVVNANLMIPIEGGGTVNDVLSKIGRYAATPAANAAAKLWAGLPGEVHHIFVVVAESKGATHTGFWVPDVRYQGRLLPGAPRAFNGGTGDSVFVDDLQPLPFPDEEIQARWRKYLCDGQPGTFLGKLFVSLPVRSRLTPEESVPVAVVNINVHGDRIWHRAYSRAWLERATKVASPWLSTAWHAFGIAYELDEASKGALPLPKARAFPDGLSRPGAVAELPETIQDKLP